MNDPVARLLTAVTSASGPVTVGRLVALSGLGRVDVERVLPDLVRRLDCVLRVTEDGEILYDFGPAPRARFTAADRCRQALIATRERLGAAGRRIFAVWSFLMLVVYGVAFLLAGLAVLAASSRGGGSGGIGQAAWGLIRFLGSTIREALTRGGDPVEGLMTPLPGMREKRQSSPGEPVVHDLDCSLRELAARTRSLPLHERSFGFLFGLHPRRHRREDRDRLFLDHVLANRGLAVASDWVLLFGTPLDEADREVSRCYARYGADVSASNGTVVYDFRSLLPSNAEEARAAEGRRPHPFPTIEVAEWALARLGGVAAFVIGFGLIIFGGSLACLWEGFVVGEPGHVLRGPLSWVTTWVPLAFSISLFGILGGRLLSGGFSRTGPQLRAALLCLAATPGRSLPAEPSARAAVLAAVWPIPIDAAGVSRVLLGLLRDLGAEWTGPADPGSGAGGWVFPVISRELTEVTRLRAQAGAVRDPGRVIYSTSE